MAKNNKQTNIIHRQFIKKLHWQYKYWHHKTIQREPQVIKSQLAVESGHLHSWLEMLWVPFCLQIIFYTTKTSSVMKLQTQIIEHLNRVCPELSKMIHTVHAVCRHAWLYIELWTEIWLWNRSQRVQISYWRV